MGNPLNGNAELVFGCYSARILSCKAETVSGLELRERWRALGQEPQQASCNAPIGAAAASVCHLIEIPSLQGEISKSCGWSLTALNSVEERSGSRKGPLPLTNTTHDRRSHKKGSESL